MARPKQDSMNAEQTLCFQRYVAMGESRTIKKLHAELQTDAKFNHITNPQLARWSQRFGWPALAKRVNDAVVAKVTREIEPIIEDMAHAQIAALHKIQQRFIQRLRIDPTDPNLNEDQKRRAIDPDLKDFMEAVKMERLILGDPTERREVVQESRITTTYNKAELIELARRLTSQQVGAFVPELPAPETIEGESSEVENNASSF